MANTKITSKVIADDAILTAHIADDQVTLAKMAGLARGKIIYGDSSGNPAALALGSNGQVLKSDGTDIAWAADTDTALTSEEVQDIVGAMFSSNTETGITATYQDADGTVDLVVGTLNQDTTGTAATVTGAAQTNITSLGTLTALTVDDITIDGSTITDGGTLTIDANDVIVQGKAAFAQIALKDNDGNADGYVYAESGDVGFLDDDGNWAYKHDTDTSHQFKINDSERMLLQDSGPVLTITEAGSDGYEDMLKLVRTHASSTAAGLVFHLTGTGGTAQATAIFVEQQEDWTSGTSRSSNLQMQAKIDGTDRNHIQVGSFGDGTSEIRLSTMDSIRIKADSAGHVTMPATAAFLARPSGGQNNLAVNVDHTISFGTEIFDQNADFASHTFTAPVTGKYQLNASVQFYDSDSATAYHHVKIITSNRAYQNIASLNKMSGDPAYWTFNISVLADMDANDTAYVMVAIPNTGSAQADITTESFFSGFLAC